LLADAQNDPDIEAQAVRPLLGRRGDAVLITPVDRRRSGDRGGAGGAARAAGPVRRADAHYVGIDHDQAITDLLTHLTGTGRTRLELIGSDPSMSTSWERQTAFTTRAAQIDPLTAELVLLGDYSVEWGRAAASRILDRWPDADAMVCANDLIGIGVLQELHRRGVPVPGRVAVTGFDDTPLAAASEPSLTRVRQPVARGPCVAAP
jgi:LacI family transcriptional regulator